MMRNGPRRPVFMKRSLLLFALFFAAPAFAQQPPEIRFHSAPDFLQLPSDLYLGEVTGVAVNSKGHVFVFSRGSTTGPPMAPPPGNPLNSGPTARFPPEMANIP